MTSRTGSRRLAGAALVAVLSLAAGCGQPDPDAAARDAKLDRLIAAVEDLTAAQREVAEAVRRQDRRLATLGRELATDPTSGAAGAAAGAGGEDAPGELGTGAEVIAGGPASTEAEAEAQATGAMERVLASDAGREAIARAAAAEVERREADERRTFVSFTIGRFARDAGLDAQQTDALQGIWKDSLDAGVTLRRDFAALRELPEAERQAARDALMETMRGIGRDRNQRVAALLTQTQLERYEPVEKEIVEAMHGAPRRAGAAPGGERRQ